MADETPGRFADHRGVIEDILAGPIDQVTRIFTREGCVRGNHRHERTEQFTYVLSGRLIAVQEVPGGEPQTRTLVPGDLLHEPAGLAHAWQADTDCTVMVFTRGPRSGAAYETDTRRLDVPLIPPGSAAPAPSAGHTGNPAEQVAWMQAHIKREY